MNIRKFVQANYNYLILTVVFLTLTVGMGVQSTFGVFFTPMSKEFGWDRATTSGPFTIYLIVWGLLSIVFGRLSDRVKAWKLISGGAVVLGAGFILMSTVKNIWQLDIYYGVLVALGISMMHIPLISLVVKHFRKKRGLLTGIALSGVGFGIAVVPLIASQLIVSYKWRNAELSLGIAAIAIIILLAQLLRKPPEPETAEVITQTPATTASVQTDGPTLKDAVKMRAFWMMTIAWFVYGFFYFVPLVHIVPYAQDLKMTVVAAATVMTLIGLVGIAGRISLGYVGDRLTNRVTFIIAFVGMAAAFLGLCLSHTIWMLYIFAIIYGFLSGAGILLTPIVAEYFGVKNVGTVSGILIAANCFGGALGPFSAGVIYDATNSYVLAFIICVALAVIAGIFYWLMKQRKTGDTAGIIEKNRG